MRRRTRKRSERDEPPPPAAMRGFFLDVRHRLHRFLALFPALRRFAPMLASLALMMIISVLPSFATAQSRFARPLPLCSVAIRSADRTACAFGATMIAMS